MATDFVATVHLPTDVAGAFSLVTDPEYLDWKQQQMKARDIHNSVSHSGDTSTVLAERKFPAALPAAAKAVVGETILIREEQTWGPPAADGSRSGRLAVTFAGAPMSLDGTLALVPVGQASELRINVSARCTLPFVGGKLEQIAGEQFLNAVKIEERLAPQWLAR